MLYRCPFQDSLETIAAFGHTDKELHEIHICLGNGSVAAADKTMEWWEEDEFWEAAVAEEDGDMLVSPTPVSPSTCAGTNSFEVGADQDPKEAGII